MAFFNTSRIPSIVKWIFPNYYIWDKKSTSKTIYLTFDDGPIPEITSFVLDTLSRKNEITENTSNSLKPVPATFFCIGDNVRKHPKIFYRIIAEGHAVGNHTFNHLKGTVTDTEIYLKNTHLTELQMAKHLNPKPNELITPLFRPPYGKIKRTQAQALKKLGYQIIMYRVVAFDWEPTLTPEQCLHNVVSTARDGDIIVFHDSVKASTNMKFALPRAIAHFEKEGFSFGKL